MSLLYDVVLVVFKVVPLAARRREFAVCKLISATLTTLPDWDNGH